MSLADPLRPALPRPPAPAPRAAPLGPIGTLRVLRKNPIETWTKAHFEKRILIGPTILGQGAFVAGPDGIRRVLLDNAANYRKDGLQRRILAPGLGEGLLTIEGEDWRVQRRTLAPLFTPKTVAGFTAAMIEAGDGLVGRWLKLRTGRVIDVQKEMARATLDVLGRTIFSDGLGRSPDEFMQAISHYFETIGQLDPFDLLDFPTWLPRMSHWRSRSSLAFFEEAVESLIAKRKRQLAKNPDAVPRDLMTLLLEAQDPETGVGLTPHEVRANIITFIGAGHETTANALTWALYLLSLSAEWRERLAAEAECVLEGPAESLLERLVETRAVVEEAMRLYPPVASLSREAMGPDDLCGRRIRKGTLILIAPWVLHRHRLLWEEPDCFDPSRFLPGQRDKIDRFAYLPFGAGPRVCIGMGFALQEAVIILAKIMRHFHLSAVASHVVRPVQHITLRPQGGMPMVLHRR